MTQPFVTHHAMWMLYQEAKALQSRLAIIKPFALHEPMVPAAAVSPPALTAIERFLIRGRRELRDYIEEFLEWLKSPTGKRSTPSEAQRRFTVLRLKFNAVLSHFDLFADVITQRSEHETGVWLSGLDAVAADALALPRFYQSPPVVCYLDRGVGAAIRRARTRLPGGGENPVAIVRVPRERLVGSSIASSLFHEVGHQASALLNLVNSMRSVLQDRRCADNNGKQSVWSFWGRWVSEVLSDFWSVARVGVGSTLGLMGVVSLPRAFVFRVTLNDPHPFPWIRVKTSCAIGQALYPDPQWKRLAMLWESFYPLNEIDYQRRELIERLEESLPELVSLIVNHCPAALQGKSLITVMEVDKRTPEILRSYHNQWNEMPEKMYRAPPSVVFAVIGQAKIDNQTSPEEESKILSKLLTYWALHSTLDNFAICATLPKIEVSIPVH